MGNIAKKFCPKCQSEDVMMVAGGTIGMWKCKKCGFSGSLFPEKEILGKDIATDDEILDGSKKK
jgi:ribosomal protein L37AE/L43A